MLSAVCFLFAVGRVEVGAQVSLEGAQVEGPACARAEAASTAAARTGRTASGLRTLLGSADKEYFEFQLYASKNEVTWS